MRRGSISAVIGLNVVQGSATNAIEQYIGTGKVDMKQVLQSGAMEGITAGLMPSGSSKSVNSIADSLDNNVDNAIGATIDSADNYLDEGVDAASAISKNVDTSPSVSSKSGNQSIVADGIDDFGDLSYAKDYGVHPYSTLKKSLKGTGLEAHHLVEKRLAKSLGIDGNSMFSVAVTKAEHQAFTNAWRDLIKYGTIYKDLSKPQIWNAAQKVYANYPKLLDAAKKTIFK